MDHAIFYQLSAVMVLGALVALVMRAFRQPMVIAYIITGFLASPSLLNIIHSQEAFESFSQIGIALLLFIIGLELNVKTIKATGKPILLTFAAVILGLGVTSFGITKLFGFTNIESLIMAIALLFSSTIIVIKALSDKKETARLYGQIATGILLAEDLVATIALVFVSAAGGNNNSGNDIFALLGKGILLGAGLTFVSGVILPRLSRLFAASQELLYIFGIAWAFGIASAFYYAGFSIEVGALFAGVAMAHLPYVQAISTRLKPLRDFFIVLFFIKLGEGLRLDNFSTAVVPALVLSALVLITKPLLIMSSLGFLGYTKQTGFKAAVHLSQISEFSIVLIMLAVSNKLVSEDLISVATLTALITIAASAYLMKYDDRLYRWLQKPLAIFERSETKKEMKALSHYPLVLLGYHQGGHSFVQTFRQMKKRYVVIDYNPDVIEHLEHQHINHIYGDATDIELLDEIGVHKSELVISVITDRATNHLLARHITKQNPKAIFICHAHNLDDANNLYAAGASYVIVSHYIGNEHINMFIKRNGSNKEAFSRYRHKHLVELGAVAVKR